VGLLRCLVVGVCLVSITLIMEIGHAADVDGIRGIHAIGPRIEIEIHSVQPFPVRAIPPVLRIGAREFHFSRSPDDGDLHTLIFLLSPAEFAQLSSGEDVSVHYGPPDALPGRALGRLDKGLLGP
jgi:hypothetical protein